MSTIYGLMSNQSRHSNKYINLYIGSDRISPQTQYYIDISLIIAGIVLSLVATTITAEDAVSSLLAGKSC